MAEVAGYTVALCLADLFVSPSVCAAMAAWTLLLLLLLLPPPPGGEPGRSGRCMLPWDRVGSDTSPSRLWTEPDSISLGVLRPDPLITERTSVNPFPSELITATFVCP